MISAVLGDVEAPELARELDDNPAAMDLEDAFDVALTAAYPLAVPVDSACGEPGELGSHDAGNGTSEDFHAACLAEMSDAGECDDNEDPPDAHSAPPLAPVDSPLGLPIEGTQPERAPMGLDCDCRGACGCHYGNDSAAREERCREDDGSGCGRGAQPKQSALEAAWSASDRMREAWLVTVESEGAAFLASRAAHARAATLGTRPAKVAK